MKLNPFFNRNHLVTAMLLTGTLAISFAGTLRTNAQTRLTTLPQTVDQKAIWAPKSNVALTLQQACANQGTKATACFANGMQRAGASPQAIAFTRSIDYMGYIQAFRPVGKVSIALVTVPFAANENQGVYLVNGNPAHLNIDDLSLLQQNELKANPVYKQLVQKYTDVVIFPGDRRINALQTEKLSNRGQRFLINYKLNDRCHACPQVGTAQFAFDFDATGRFLGTKLVTVTPSQNQTQNQIQRR